MRTNEAIRQIEAAGLDVKLNNHNVLIVYKGMEFLEGVVKLKYCHHIREINGLWCIYDGGQLPKSECSTLKAAVEQTILFIRVFNEQSV